MNTILRPISDLCERNIIFINPKINAEKEFWYIDISAVDNTTKIITAPFKTNGKTASVRARQVVHQNDVIVSTTRPNLNAVAIVPSNLHGEICSTGFCVLRCGSELHPDYLFSFVQSKLFIDSLSDLVQGALYPAVTDKQVFSQLIPWIPLDQQSQIATKLKAQLAEVETARKALQAQQADIKIFAATALDKLYSRPDKVKISKVAKIQSGYAFKSKDFKTQGIKLLRNTNILPNRIYWDDMACLPSELITEYPNYVLNEGDVILSLDRPIISTGLKVARISNKDIPALLVQRVGRFLIDTNKLDPSYLYFFLNTSFFKDAISGHEQSLGVPHISPSQVENVEIPLPDVDKQKKIAANASEVFKQIEIAKIAAKEAKKDIDSLSSRLLAQAFDL